MHLLLYLCIYMLYVRLSLRLYVVSAIVVHHIYMSYVRLSPRLHVVSAIVALPTCLCLRFM